ncbi:MAG: DUF1156 domain-containing protein [Nitrospirae bacterium]|nr:DUF1156 domain-containing protein [Nitrospirota bacterium]
MAIPKECKRLAEVDFPITATSGHAIRENSTRSNHPKSLHLWWARRPLGACRAILLGLLLPDPCDPNCPEDFKRKARQLLPTLVGTVGEADIDLRSKLLKFIADFASWDNSSQSAFLKVARSLVRTAYDEEPPLVVDTFSGGGSIPLEALRIGCETFGSDLNPVALLILKTILEDVPRYGSHIAEELSDISSNLQLNFEKRLLNFYPRDPDGSIPVAYLWARTVDCESPNCGAEIPLVRSFWLRKKRSPKQALRYKVVRASGSKPIITFEVFEPKNEKDVPPATVFQAKATCPACQSVLPSDRVRAQLIAINGGIERLRLLAVSVTDSESTLHRYRTEQAHDVCALEAAELELQRILSKTLGDGLSPIPDERIPTTELRRVSAPLYGCEHWRNLFTGRQRVALSILIEEVRKASHGSAHSDALTALLTLAFGKVVRHWNSNARWHNGSEAVAGAFGRQAIPMAWSFPEQSPFDKGAGTLGDAISSVVQAVRGAEFGSETIGQVQRADACSVPLPSDSVNVWFTDPPYYDSVAYAHLADFFYVWFKRILIDDPLFQEELIIKEEECVVDRPHSLSPSKKTSAWFESKMAAAMKEGRRLLDETGIGCVVFAHKTTEGWEALIGGMLQAGWVITASWPIATERSARLNARDNASLATSIHLVCRPRPEDASVGDWGDVLKELPNRVGDWMERLQREHIRGADLVFACIGPALEIFSRYSKVETADGREVKLAEYLEKVWEVVGRLALEQILGTAEAKARNGAAGALEEDSRLTALFLWTLQSTNGETGNGDEREDDSSEDDEDESPKGKQKGFSLVFDVVRRFAQPLGIHLEAWEGRIIETKKGVVRLFPISERAKQLFGEEGAQTIADRIESSPEESIQLTLFAGGEEAAVPEIKGRGRQKKGVMVSEESLKEHRGATTLDRVHAAMLLQASGRANALRALLKAEQERSPDFLRLANALSALYPKDSEEKRLLDAMLLAVPR